MTSALVLPVLTGAGPHLAAALADMPADAVAAARVTEIFLGDGEAVFLSDAEDEAAFTEALGSTEAQALQDALTAFTAFEPYAPHRFVLRPVSDAAKPVSGHPGFTTGGG